MLELQTDHQFFIVTDDFHQFTEMICWERSRSSRKSGVNAFGSSLLMDVFTSSPFPMISPNKVVMAASVASRPIAMHKDARIEYRLRLAGVPLYWRTRITSWEPGRGFVDEQERGPYALWEHHHVFEPTDRGVLVWDRIRYALPFGALGNLVHPIAVWPALAAIFDFRFVRVRELLEEIAEP